ncbi:MAG TPA: hypothetical protein VJ063_08870, partial [Verrucomicrobiae bacterium]|nr:hypothetical protein [Verrucomicrobiae bacterium]
MSINWFSILVLTVSSFGALRESISREVVPPTIQWSKTFAGNGEDRVAALEQMPDGGFVLGCASSSGIAGDKTATNYGGMDFWVLRLDDSARKIWETSLGGTGGDELRGAKATSNGGV